MINDRSVQSHHVRINCFLKHVLIKAAKKRGFEDATPFVNRRARRLHEEAPRLSTRFRSASSKCRSMECQCRVRYFGGVVLRACASVLSGDGSAGG